MRESVHIFLGANSGEGFFSLYEQLLHARLDDLLIVKGGPGCGKSSFMRTVADALVQSGEEPVYIHCSGDPASLDGVLFPRLKFGLVDGTAPHVLEPTYTTATERYLDLARFYDVEAVHAVRGEIIAHTDAYRAAYASAYRVLRALQSLHEERRAVVHAAADMDALNRRMDAIIRRELRGKSDDSRGQRPDEALDEPEEHLLQARERPVQRPHVLARPAEDGDGYADAGGDEDDGEDVPGEERIDQIVRDRVEYMPVDRLRRA